MKIQYFGVLSEITGTDSGEIDFSGSVDDLRRRLAEMYPDISEKRFQIAVNQKIAAEDQHLSGNEEIALLPPFTGG